MPSLRAHRYIDYLYLNKSYWKIHRAMDKPVKYLGRSHRVLFHDVISAVAIARYFYPGDPDAETAALLHIEFDTLCTADPDFKRELERNAKLFKAPSGKKRRTVSRVTSDCVLKIDRCPCFIYRAALFLNPSKARAMCPRRRYP